MSPRSCHGHVHCAPVPGGLVTVIWVSETTDISVASVPPDPTRPIFNHGRLDCPNSAIDAPPRQMDLKIPI